MIFTKRVLYLDRTQIVTNLIFLIDCAVRPMLIQYRSTLSILKKQEGKQKSYVSEMVCKKIGVRRHFREEHSCLHNV